MSEMNKGRDLEVDSLQTVEDDNHDRQNTHRK